MLSTAILIMRARKFLPICYRPNASKLFFAFHYLLPFVIATLGTSLMRRLGLLAIGTGAWSNGQQKIMRPAFSAARFGMSPFGIRHEGCSPS
jgi:hypothetical protein